MDDGVEKEIEEHGKREVTKMNDPKLPSKAEVERQSGEARASEALREEAQLRLAEAEAAHAQERAVLRSAIERRRAL